MKRTGPIHRRTPLCSKAPPPRPARQWEGPAPVQQPVRATLRSDGRARMVVPVPKTPDRVQPALRESARGEECLVRLPGCPADPAMTILSHSKHQRAGKGGAIKALDLCGAYACTYCDAVYDGQRKRPDGWTAEMVELAWGAAHLETLVKFRQKGLV